MTLFDAPVHFISDYVAGGDACAAQASQAPCVCGVARRAGRPRAQAAARALAAAVVAEVEEAGAVRRRAARDHAAAPRGHGGQPAAAARAVDVALERVSVKISKSAKKNKFESTSSSFPRVWPRAAANTAMAMEWLSGGCTVACANLEHDNCQETPGTFPVWHYPPYATDGGDS